MSKNESKLSSILRAATATLVCLAVFGCQRRYTEAECWNLMPSDPNQAKGMAIVETARTEAKTEAKIDLMNAGIETGMTVMVVVCLAITILGLWPFKNRLVMASGIVGMVVFAVGAAVMAAKAAHPKIIAGVGITYFLVLASSIVFIIIRNWKCIVKKMLRTEVALKEVVEGNENFKKRQLNSVDIFLSEQDEVQSCETEALVDKIRNGGAK